MKKYELTTNTKMHFGHKLFQIKALISFGDVEKGDIGGWIEKEENLDQEGNAWVYGDAKVCGNAWVYGNADYLTIKGIGSRYGVTTVTRTTDGTIQVACGCFFGTLEEFKAQVKKTHGDSNFAKEYELFCQIIELHFGGLKDDRQT